MNEDRKKLFTALAAPFPEEAIERTDGRVTGRGYDTSGIKYQYVVDRINEVLGIGGFRTHRTTTVKSATSAKGRPVFEALCEVRLELGEWKDGTFVVFAEAYGDGGHTAMNEADARKGAFTNGFKKAAAMLGAGRDAYRGVLDDDNGPAAEDGDDTPRTPARCSGQAEATSRAPATPIATARERERITAKQVQAIWSLVRRHGYEEPVFRQRVRERYGRQLEFLSKVQASEVIAAMSEVPPPTKPSNGHAGQELVR
jgi:hypothetical protein